MNITIKNCNNIDNGSIGIKENQLNIKYAINGTGKSTIAKALESLVDNEKDINDLLPFKYRKNTDKQKECFPTIVGFDQNSNIAVFNELYVNQFIYKQEEVIENSFDIFVRTDDYDERMKKIEELILTIKKTFIESADLQVLIRDLVELSDCFGKSKSGYSAAGSLGKGIGKGNKLEHIPQNLEDYKDFLISDSNTQ
jgi:hypothetical protein